MRYIKNDRADPTSLDNASLRSGFGETVTVENTPQFQHDFQYGILDQVFETFTGTGGTATESDSQAILQTGTSVGGYAVVRSKRYLQYKPGQSAMCRFTALFTTGVANSLQLAGLGSQENVLSFGYNGTSFGILRRTGGKAEIRTLTVSVASTAGTAVVTLNGTPFNVSLTGLGSTAGDAWELSQGTYTGWRAEQVGSTVVFTSDSIGSLSSTYSYVGVGSGAGTFATTRAGASNSDSWTAQSSWNLDKMDGTGRSGQILDPTKGNVYSIKYQWLGYGAITFGVENRSTGLLVEVHRIDHANANTTPSLISPHMQLSMVAASLGSTTNLTVKSASMGAFIQGRANHVGPAWSTSNTKTLSTTLTALFTVKPARVFKSRYNFGEMHPVIFSGSSSSAGAKPGVIEIHKNATLAGTPNYSFVDSDSSVLVDTAGTTLSNGEVIASFSLPSTGSFIIDISALQLVINKADSLTIAAKSSSGSIDFYASLIWLEDH